MADKLGITQLPTEEMLGLIGRYAPEISMGRNLQMEARINQVCCVLAGLPKG